MDNYTERAEVATGAFSNVYRAVETNTSRVVALKIMDHDFVKPPHSIEQELQILKKLRKCDGFLQFFTSFNVHDDVVIVTEYYNGLDLYRVLKNKFFKERVQFNFSDPSQNKKTIKNNLPPQAADKMVERMIEVLASLHEHEIIHRDIKPSNWFFKSDDMLHEPILGDFGISYDTEDPGKEHPQNKYTDVSTLYYKAPELCFGVTDYGFEVDVWSLGILISLLYSPDGKVVVADDNDEFSDLGLVSGVFKNFGTPTITDETSELYWPEMKNDQYHFNKLDFAPRDRKNVDQLLPRCTKENIKRAFSRMMVYSRGKRITSKQCEAIVRE